MVTHAGVISQVVGALHGINAARWEAFRVGNASITRMQWQGGAGVVSCFDDRAHLSACSPAPQRIGAAHHA